jgi:uncharacterized Zn finger protein
MSDDLGVTAWGRDWVRLAQPTSITRPNPALPRARSLVRNDKVGDVVIAAGSITATVFGARDQHVSVHCPIWADDAAKSARAALRGLPAGDVPDSVHADWSKAGMPAGPSRDELTADCDCPQRTRPCVHVLAVFFEIARRMDERPVSAVELRGVSTSPDADAARLPIDGLDPATFYG